MTRSPRTRSGFSLFELAIALLLAGLVAGLALQFSTEANRQDNYTDTKAKLERVREAVNRYAVSNNRFPMPARRDIGVDDPHYGKEAVLANLDAIPSAGGVAVYGALPFSALGLMRDEAIDSWGNKLTYIVTQDLTDKTKFNDNTNGAIDVNSRVGVKFLEGAGFVVISHGADEYGAVKENYKGTSKRWCEYDAAKAGKTANCSPVKAGVPRAFAISTTHNDGKDATGAFFDDVVTFKGKPWIPGGTPGRCGATAGTCISGNARNYVAGSPCNTATTWDCEGLDGGSTAFGCAAATSCPCDIYGGISYGAGNQRPGGPLSTGIIWTGLSCPYHPGIYFPCYYAYRTQNQLQSCPASSAQPSYKYCSRSERWVIYPEYPIDLTPAAAATRAAYGSNPPPTSDTGWGLWSGPGPSDCQ